MREQLESVLFIRIPADLRRRLGEAARTDRRSVASMCRVLLERALDRQGS